MSKTKKKKKARCGHFRMCHTKEGDKIKWIKATGSATVVPPDPRKRGTK